MVTLKMDQDKPLTNAQHAQIYDKLEWQPVSHWSADLYPRKLTTLDNGDLSFVSNGISSYYYLGFIIIALCVWVLLSDFNLKGFSQKPMTTVLHSLAHAFTHIKLHTVLGFLLVLAAGFSYYQAHNPKVFSLSEQAYYQGWLSWRKQIPFNEIYALQIMNKQVTTRVPKQGTEKTISPKPQTRQHTSFELNLVLSEGSRVNMICLKDKTEIIGIGDTLAKKLNLPLWQAPASHNE